MDGATVPRRGLHQAQFHGADRRFGAHIFDPENGGAVLFEGEQGAGPHLVRFSGVVDANEPAGEATLTRRVVPPGDYTVTVEAGGRSQSVPLRVEQAQGAPPTLQNVTVFPQNISPNGDAVEDVAEVTFRTNETATLAVDLYGSDGERIAVMAPSKIGPGEQNVVVIGRDTLDEPLPDGDYRVNARLGIDEVNELLDVELPSTEWDSIGGLLFNLVGGVPREGQEIEFQGLRLRAERVQGRRIGRVRIHRLRPPEESEDITAQARRL